MSVYLNGVTDTIRAVDSSVTLTVGTGDFSIGLWVRTPSLPGNSTGVCWIAQSSTLSGQQYAGLIYRQPSNSFQIFWTASSETSNDTYSISANTWYWVVASRSGTTTRCRVFDDSTSTTPLQNSTGGSSDNMTGLDTFMIGMATGSDDSHTMQCTNYKIYTGAEWTNAECRTEAQYFGIQKSGGTDRLCWRLKDIDADTDGLNEFGGSGPNFTNSGAVADANNPTNLSEYAISVSGTDGQKMSDSSSFFVRPTPSICRIVSTL